MKKTLSFILTILTAMSVFTFAASAKTAQPGDGTLFQTAKELEFGSQYTETVEEKTFYRFTLDKTSELKFESATMTDYSPEVKIYNKPETDGYDICGYFNSNGIIDEKCYLSAGDYYISLSHSYLGGTTITFTVTATPLFESFEESQTHHNNNMYNTSEIKLENTYEGVLGEFDNRDIYKLDIKENDTKIRFQLTDYLADRRVRVYGDGFVYLFDIETSAENAAPFEFELGEGTHYIEISGEKGSYKFNIRYVLEEPEMKSAENTDDGIKLTWNEVSNASLYTVYRTTGKTWKKIGETKSHSFTDKTAEKGTKYTYCVKASNSYVTSLYRNNQISAVRLSKPTVKSTSLSDAIKLTWNKIEGAKGYNIYRKTTKGWSLIGRTYDNTETSYTDTTVKNGTTYSYMVCAVSDSSQSVKSAITTRTFLKKNSVSKVTSEKKALTLTWSKNSSASGYEIQYSTSSKFTSSSTKSVKITSSNTVTKTIKSLKAGQKYYVRVRAFKSVSDTNYYSVWSSAKSITVKK